MPKFIWNDQLYQKIFEFIQLYKIENEGENPSFREISRYFSIALSDAKLYGAVVLNKDKLGIYTDEDLKEALDKERKRSQGFQDRNRIANKRTREHDRIPNALIALNEEMIKHLKQHSFKDTNPDEKILKIENVFGNPLETIGIIHWSDWHLNEIVKMVGINFYDLNLASKMIRKLTAYAIFKFKSLGIKNVLVVNTGDTLNSDRRLDEKLSMATNRTKAAFIGIEISRAALLDLSQNFDNVMFVGVTGNETRVPDELGWGELIMTDNYDYTIYKTLQFIFSGHKNIIIPNQPSYTELPINICGQEWLITHGHSKILQGDVERGVIQVTGKWSDHGHDIKYILFGHLHYTRIGDHFSRGASLVGANAYSNKALQLITKSAQNIHVAFPNGDIFNERVDLTNVKDITGYRFTKELEAYNPKSTLKTKQGKTIISIQI